MKINRVFGSYSVKDEILSGKRVFVVDRKNPTIGVEIINDLPYEHVIKVLESEEDNRFDFWTIEEEGK